MKRSEMIERLTKVLSNQYPDCHDIRSGMDNDAAVAVLNACEEAGMMPPVYENKTYYLDKRLENYIPFIQEWELEDGHN